MSVENPLLAPTGMLCLAVGGALFGGDRARRRSAAALVVLGLALAAWHAGSPPQSDLPAPQRLGDGFLVGNGALLLLGLVLVGSAALRAPPGRLRLAARLLTAAGVVLLGPVLTGFLGAAGPLRAAGAALGVGLVAGAVAVGTRAMATRSVGRSLGHRLAPPPLDTGVAVRTGPRSLLAALALGLLATVIGPHVAVVSTGLVVAVWAGYFAFHPPGARPVPVAPVLTLLLLIPTWWFLATITGPLGLALTSLSEVPLSPAAELLVSPALLLVGWAAAGLWPLQRQLPGALLAPAAAAFLARLALPLTPGGLEYWRALTVPLLLLGLWNAAAHARWPLLLAGAAVLGVAAGPPVDLAAVAVLVSAALLLELVALAPVPLAAAWLLRVVTWPVATWAGLRLLEEWLRGEVVYTALGALGLALILVSRRSRPR